MFFHSSVVKSDLNELKQTDFISVKLLPKREFHNS